MKLASKFKTATVLGAVCAAFAVPAHAEFTGSAGLGVHVWDGGYRDTDAQVWPIPAVDVETDHFYFKGLEAGGFLVKTDAHRLIEKRAMDTRMSRGEVAQEILEEEEEE